MKKPQLFARGALLKAIDLRRFALLLFIFYAVSLNAPAIFAQAANSLDLMPMPAHIVQGDGQFTIDGNFNVALQGYTEPRLASARTRFMETLSRETGIPFHKDAKPVQAVFTVKTAAASDPVIQLGEDESYHIEITTSHIQLTAKNPLGVLHGLQTFLQLVRITP